MKKSAFLFIFLLLSCAAFCGENPPSICFKQTCLSLEIADTESARIKGLMFCKNLPEKSGMLFVFPDDGIYSFWMKNTFIPLDMIWLDKDYRVVYIKCFVPICDSADCPSYDPGVKARYVLEVNAGFTKKYKIKINDKAFLKK